MLNALRKALSNNIRLPISYSFFFFNDTATTEIYTLSLHDALPIYQPDDDLHRPRPHEEEEEAVDHERDEQDLDDVRPEPRDQKAIRFEVHGALFVAAHATARASRASATSWTRKRRAPRSQASAQATAVARSRSSTGRPVACPRKRLREGPTATA